MRDATRIRVDGEAPYDVVVGRGVLDELADLVGGSGQRVAVIHPRVLAARAAELAGQLRRADLDVVTLALPDGEAAKTSDVASSCWQQLGRRGFTRSDVVVGLGGGATTDVAGFVAATFLRGIRLVNVPTTLLGMVDAAVGGKTGVNTAEGKNLVGAFHEPAGVLCDLSVLDTLSRAEVVSGLAEVVKCGFIADTAILHLIEADPAAATDPSSEVTRELVERAVTVKARVVARDLHETTSTGAEVGRESLNYGHTLGHAIERVESFGVRHGAAVAIGMVYAATLARLAGRLDADVVQRHRDVLSLVGLPTSDRGDRWESLLAAMRVDKKTRGNRLRFVVLEDLARPVILEGPAPDLLAAAYAAISR